MWGNGSVRVFFYVHNPTITTPQSPQNKQTAPPKRTHEEKDEVVGVAHHQPQTLAEARLHLGLLRGLLALPAVRHGLARGGVKAAHDQEGRKGDEGVDVEGCLVPPKLVVHEARADDAAGEPEAELAPEALLPVLALVVQEAQDARVCGLGWFGWFWGVSWVMGE